MSNDISKRDPQQIARYEHDEVLGCKRVSVVGTEMAIELSADDGDSVLVRPETTSLSPQLGAAIDVSKFKTIQIYAKKQAGGTDSQIAIHIGAGPAMLIEWPSLSLGAEGAVVASGAMSICATTMQLVGNGNGLVDIVVVGRGL